MNLPRIFFGNAFLKICILFLILAVHLIGSSMAIAETKNAAHQNQQVYTKDEKEFVKAFLQVLNAAKDKREQLSSEALVYIDAGVLPKSLNWEMIVAMSAIQPTPYKYPTGKKLREFFDRQNKNFISDFEFYQRHVSKIRPLNWGGYRCYNVIRDMVLRLTQNKEGSPCVPFLT